MANHHIGMYVRLLDVLELIERGKKIAQRNMEGQPAESHAHELFKGERDSLHRLVLALEHASFPKYTETEISHKL